MKIIYICILFFLAWGSATGKDDADTTQPIFPQQLTARDLLTYCSSSSLTDLGRKRQSYCSGFISGVEETIRLPSHASSQAVAMKICVPEGVTSRSLAKAYTQHARRSDTNLAQPAAQIVVEALSKSYQCQQ
ncbi:MAG: hypothetical protein KJN89_14125 [Gammaproteobacteria bacterium]|nr:hypothetical protein [Gammaproteobacteria bacterium]MBT8133790.1 hypothetical protein [Gammaproteobacteria bacterium]NNJ51510.1 hypothetical protein [Gammaproteobacteria bacterium]